MRRPIDATREWWTLGIPDRSGIARYTEMIRGPHDPERLSREARKAAGRDTTWWRSALRGHPREWGPRILELLSDGEPRTLNAITVLLIDACADMTIGSPLAEALWALCHAGMVEFTPSAPVLFRATYAPAFRPIEAYYELAAGRVREALLEDAAGEDGDEWGDA